MSKRSFWRVLSMLLMGLLVCLPAACGKEQTPEATEGAKTNAPTPTEPETDAPVTPPAVLEKGKPYTIMFIGNSYTYYNDMPAELFRSIMEAAGYDVSVVSVTKGAWYLINSAKDTDELGSQVKTMLSNVKFDFVVLQEQSTCPILDPGKFYTGVRELASKVRANGATPILYETWGRKTGHSALAQNGWTNESMTWQLAAAYEAIGAELGVDVAHVGRAFFDVYRSHPEIELYDADLTHPSLLGSYLAALTIFAEITGMDPTEVNYNGTLPAEYASILKAAAARATRETPAVPEAYQTASEGIEYAELKDRVDDSASQNLTAIPKASLISVLSGGTYPNGKSFSGLLGTKGAIASLAYSSTGLTAAQKADIANPEYGVSVIGIERMNGDAKGYATAVQNLVNGHWGSTLMASFAFDDLRYDIQGQVGENAPYRGLITLNFGTVHRFDAMGFASGNLQGFPGAAEVFVSDDGVNWTRIPSACWDCINGKALVNCGPSAADPWNGNTAKTVCLFNMAGVQGQYIRIGVVIGSSGQESSYNLVNTREILVYGEKLS